MNLKGKHVLVVGLGTLGGGVATIRWLMTQGAILTITDLRIKKDLKPSFDTLRFLRCKTDSDDVMMCHDSHGRTIRFVFGRHRKKDFENADLVVVGPAVNLINNTFITISRKKGIPVINDLTLFLENVKNPVIAVTGTRGKTTTTTWIARFLSTKHKGVRASGNSSNDALLKLLPRLQKHEEMPAVLELSSFQLELGDRALKAPDIAIITNLYQDHLNRHKTMRNYALAKANVFKKQTLNQILALNKDNEWTGFFLKQKPKSNIFFFSQKSLPKNAKGIYVEKGSVKFKDEKVTKIIIPKTRFSAFKKSWGEHNAQNLLGSLLVSYLSGIPWNLLIKAIGSLPSIPYREEVIVKKKNLIVINDTTATSPEGGIAAIRRFGGKNTVLIAGGTDKNLEYNLWAREVKNYIEPPNLFLLDGSTTKKMIKALEDIRYFKNHSVQLYEHLLPLLKTVKHSSPSCILFSPAAASFEKFKNEFDRGEKFSLYSKQLF